MKQLSNASGLTHERGTFRIWSWTTTLRFRHSVGWCVKLRYVPGKIKQEAPPCDKGNHRLDLTRWDFLCNTCPVTTHFTLDHEERKLRFRFNIRIFDCLREIFICKV